MVESLSFARLPLRRGAGLPADAFEEIKSIQTRQRFNSVVHSGSSGFIPSGR
jgi:alcohol dehydrogenase (NADP+)